MRLFNNLAAGLSAAALSLVFSPSQAEAEDRCITELRLGNGEFSYNSNAEVTNPDALRLPIGSWAIRGGSQGMRDGQRVGHPSKVVALSGTLAPQSEGNCLTDIHARAASDGQSLNPLDGYEFVGWWGVASGGALDSFGENRYRVLWLYAKRMTPGERPAKVVSDLWIHVHESSAANVREGFEHVANWDVEHRDSAGRQVPGKGTTEVRRPTVNCPEGCGFNMATLSVKKTDYIPPRPVSQLQPVAPQVTQQETPSAGNTAIPSDQTEDPSKVAARSPAKRLNENEEKLSDPNVGNAVDVLDTIDDLVWVTDRAGYATSCSGRPSEEIIHVHDPLDREVNDALYDNYLCGNVAQYITYHTSLEDRPENKRCEPLRERAKNVSGTLTWEDNTFCTDFWFPYELKFSTNGELHTLKEGGFCLQTTDAAGYWNDNYLCFDPTDDYTRDLRALRAQAAGNQRPPVIIPIGPVTSWSNQEITNYAASFHPKRNHELYQFMDDISKLERAAMANGLNEEQRHGYVTWRDVELFFFPDGAATPPELTCLQMTNLYGLSDPNITNINNRETGGQLCSRHDLGLRWSTSGGITGMDCKAMNDNGTNQSDTNDHWFCAPGDSEIHYRVVKDGKIDGMQDKCLSLAPHGNYSVTAAAWQNNYLCYDRHRLRDLNGHWEQAAAPCPSCPEVDFEVSYGVEKGKEVSEESSFGIEVGISNTFKYKVGAVENETEVSYTFSHDWSTATSRSFSQSQSETTTIPCHLGSVWQWVSVATRDCAFGTPCPALTARSDIIQCTVDDDVPIHSPNWSPCEPVFNDNLSGTPIRRQNAGTRSDTPGGWRCRAENEIIIEQATYGRSCNAPVGNVTDFVATSCQGSRDSGTCTFEVDMERLGRPGGAQCAHNFEVQYTCPGDGDLLRTAYVPGEAGHKTTIGLNCVDEDAPRMLNVTASAAPSTLPKLLTVEERTALALEALSGAGLASGSTNASDDKIASAITALTQAIANRPQPPVASEEQTAAAIRQLSAAIAARPTPQIPDLRGSLKAVGDAIIEAAPAPHSDERTAIAITRLAQIIQARPVPAPASDAQTAAAIQALSKTIAERPISDLTPVLMELSSGVFQMADAMPNDSNTAQAIMALTRAIAARPVAPPPDMRANQRAAIAMERIAAYVSDLGEFGGHAGDEASTEAIQALTQVIARMPQAQNNGGDARVAAAIENLARAVASRPACAVAAAQCAPQGDVGFGNDFQQRTAIPGFDQPSANPDFATPQFGAPPLENQGFDQSGNVDQGAGFDTGQEFSDQDTTWFSNDGNGDISQGGNNGNNGQFGQELNDQSGDWFGQETFDQQNDNVNHNWIDGNSGIINNGSSSPDNADFIESYDNTNTADNFDQSFLNPGANSNLGDDGFGSQDADFVSEGGDFGTGDDGTIVDQ